MTYRGSLALNFRPVVKHLAEVEEPTRPRGFCPVGLPGHAKGDCALRAAGIGLRRNIGYAPLHIARIGHGPARRIGHRRDVARGNRSPSLSTGFTGIIVVYLGSDSFRNLANSSKPIRLARSYAVRPNSSLTPLTAPELTRSFAMSSRPD